MAWIHCGLDSLWLGSNLTSLRPEGQVANNCNNLLQFITTLTPYGLDSLWLGLTVVWIHCGLAQISRAYGQRAKSLTLLARVTIYYNPHPCGLDSLCLGLDNWTNFGQFSCSIYNLVNIAPWGEWKLTNDYLGKINLFNFHCSADFCSQVGSPFARARGLLTLYRSLYSKLFAHPFPRMSELHS